MTAALCRGAATGRFRNKWRSLPRAATPLKSTAVPDAAGWQAERVSDLSSALPLARVLRLETSRARAPAKASTWRGGSRRQAEVHPPVTEGDCVVATRGGA